MRRAASGARRVAGGVPIERAGPIKQQKVARWPARLGWKCISSCATRLAGARARVELINALHFGRRCHFAERRPRCAALRCLARACAASRPLGGCEKLARCGFIMFAHSSSSGGSRVLDRSPLGWRRALNLRRRPLESPTSAQPEEPRAARETNEYNLISCCYLAAPLSEPARSLDATQRRAPTACATQLRARTICMRAHILGAQLKWPPLQLRAAALIESGHDPRRPPRARA